MLRYEEIQNIYKRKSTRKNSKWILENTVAKEISKEEADKDIEQFENVPTSYEKHIENFETYGKRYIVINGLIKREIILIPIED